MSAESIGGTNIWAGPIILGPYSGILQAGEFWWDDVGIITLRIIGSISGTGYLRIDDSVFDLTNNVVYLEGATANTYSGGTVVEGANVVLAKTVVNGGIGSGTLTIGQDYHGPASVRLELNAQIPDADPVNINTNGVLNLNNISDTFGALNGGGSLVLGSGTAGPNSDDGSSTFSGVISGTGGVKKHGSGTLTLTGTNTFSGTNEIVLGTEIVNGQQLAASVLVDSPAKFGGNGTVGNVKCNGRLAPGDGGPGTLTTSNLVFTSTGTFLAELASPANCDNLNVRGLVTLGSATSPSAQLSPFPPPSDRRSTSSAMTARMQSAARSTDWRRRQHFSPVVTNSASPTPVARAATMWC